MAAPDENEQGAGTRRPYHLEGELPRFWRLQRVARKADMRLTSDGERLHLRDAAGEDHIVTDLDEAEKVIGGGDE